MRVCGARRAAKELECLKRSLRKNRARQRECLAPADLSMDMRNALLLRMDVISLCPNSSIAASASGSVRSRKNTKHLHASNNGCDVTTWCKHGEVSGEQRVPARIKQWTVARLLLDCHLRRRLHGDTGVWEYRQTEQSRGGSISSRPLSVNMLEAWERGY